MADYRDGLYLLPEHMHEGISWWIEKGEPHPKTMGSFQRAVLENDLMGAVGKADHINQLYIARWCDFLYNFAPEDCHGSPEKLLAWYEHKHPKPTAEGT